MLRKFYVYSSNFSRKSFIELYYFYHLGDYFLSHSQDLFIFFSVIAFYKSMIYSFKDPIGIFWKKALKKLLNEYLHFIFKNILTAFFSRKLFSNTSGNIPVIAAESFFSGSSRRINHGIVASIKCSHVKT